MVLKIDLNMMPVLLLGISGDRPVDELKTIAEDVIKPRLERLDGVASVEVTGGLTEIRVIVEPEKLAAHGLSMSSVVQALQAQNINLSAGRTTRGGQEMALRVIGDKDVAQIAGTSLTTPAGANIRLDDVARWKMALKIQPASAGWESGTVLPYPCRSSPVQYRLRGRDARRFGES